MRFKMKANGKTYEVVPAGAGWACHKDEDTACAAFDSDSDVGCDVDSHRAHTKTGCHFGGLCTVGKLAGHIFLEVLDVNSNRA